MNRSAKFWGAVAIVITLLAGGCASSSSSVNTLLHDPAYKDHKFRNILVIGVAADYDGRAQFEREMVSAISRTGTTATAFYTVVGHNPEITRNSVTNAVRSRDFDAVLITRIQGQEETVDVKRGSSETKTTTKGGDVFNLFRYDYAVLNEPDHIKVNSTVVLVTEVYATADEKKIWAIETTNPPMETAGQLISSQVDAISKRMRKDGLVGG